MHKEHPSLPETFKVENQEVLNAIGKTFGVQRDFAASMKSENQVFESLYFDAAVYHAALLQQEKTAIRLVTMLAIYGPALLAQMKVVNPEILNEGLDAINNNLVSAMGKLMKAMGVEFLNVEQSVVWSFAREQVRFLDAYIKRPEFIGRDPFAEAAGKRAEKRDAESELVFTLFSTLVDIDINSTNSSDTIAAAYVGKFGKPDTYSKSWEESDQLKVSLLILAHGILNRLSPGKKLKVNYLPADLDDAVGTIATEIRDSLSEAGIEDPEIEKVETALYGLWFEVVSQEA